MSTTAVSRLPVIEALRGVAAIIVLLNFASTLSPLYRGEPFQVSAPQLLLHLGYLNSFFSYPWLNVVYWSLAIEFQYYILIAVVYGAIGHRSRRVWIPVCIALFLCGLPETGGQYVVQYLPLFVLGVVTFKFRIGHIGPRGYVLAILLLGASLVPRWGIVVACLTTSTALAIAFINARVPVLGSIGVVSYSLYLLHVPIGGRVVNLGNRFARSLSAEAGVALLALAVTLLSAWVLFRVVERPARRWSSSIKYRRSSADSGIGMLREHAT